MQFYEVAVESRALKNVASLTYSSDEDMSPGAIVRVPLRRSFANGIVLKRVSQPDYLVKPIHSILYDQTPPHLVDAARWMSDYYATDLGAVISSILPRGVHKKRRATEAPLTKRKELALLPQLTDQQKSAITSLRGKTGTNILHGVTGSGKTRVYLELIAHQQQSGRGCIVLVPEIGLTSQMVDDITAYIDEVFVVHSKQTEAVRHAQWEAILRAEKPVVIGPRSALFSPIKDIGAIIIDESHEPTYKQDQTPKYHASRVASYLGSQLESLVVLGSATPRVEDLFLAKLRDASGTKDSAITTLTQPVHDTTHTTTVEVVDLRAKGNRNPHSAIISIPLYKQIVRSLENGSQTLIFHNRRGSSTSVICKECGWLAVCPHCELPLTHHADTRKLLCHFCGHSQSIRLNCDECGQAELQYRGIGTKAIEAEIRKLFPDAETIRFDGDSQKGQTLADRFDDVRRGRLDIIIGTQMIAKGLDLPKLSTVGVVLADTALHLADYSAGERAFQLLYQVIGRTGRHQDGTVVIQTFSPEHPAIVHACKRSFQDFYDQEIADREHHLYPPFAHLLHLTYEAKTLATARKHAESLAEKLHARNGVQVWGPSPAFYEKTPTGYRWQIVVKSKKRDRLTGIVDSLPSGWQHNLDPINLL